MQNEVLCEQLDHAHNAVRYVGHGHFQNDEVRLRLELAGAHLRAAYRIAAHGKTDPCDEPHATHAATMQGWRICRAVADRRRS
ncbi:MAG: hypothetical protein JJU00_14785 [Opitutales bacterium]|nr:hypothetical protein [Opitutales bacterium]